MDVFLKNKRLWVAVFLLLVINVGLTGYIFLKVPESKGKKANRPVAEVLSILKNELALSDDQLQKLEAIRGDFFKKEEVLSTLIKSQRDSMNMYMFNEKTDTILVKSIARRAADNEYQMELYRIEQALSLKKICSPEQMKKFEGMVKDLRDYFKPIKK